MPSTRPRPGVRKEPEGCTEMVLRPLPVDGISASNSVDSGPAVHGSRRSLHGRRHTAGRKCCRTGGPTRQFPGPARAGLWSELGPGSGFGFRLGPGICPGFANSRPRATVWVCPGLGLATGLGLGVQICGPWHGHQRQKNFIAMRWQRWKHNRSGPAPETRREDSPKATRSSDI